MGGKPRNSEPIGVEAMYRQMRTLVSSTAEVGPRKTAWERRVEIAPGVVSIALKTPTLPPATATNCYLLGHERLVLVDPATPDPSERAVFDELLADLEARGQRASAIWLTHHHGDHIADAVRLAERHEIPIAAHPATAARLTRVPISIALEEGDRHDLGDGVSLEVVFTPGHAPGHLCFFERGSGSLVAGDMVAGVGTILIDPSEGDMIEYLDSLRRLMALGTDRLLPAHGPVLDDPGAALGRYITHRLWREAKVRQALSESPASPADLLPRVYDDVPTFLYPLAERSLISHLVKLEREGDALTDSGGWRSARAK